MKTIHILTSVILILLVSCKEEVKTVEKIVYTKETSTLKTEATIDIKENESAIITKQRVVDFYADFSNIDDFKNNLNKFIIHAELNKSQG